MRTYSLKWDKVEDGVSYRVFHRSEGEKYDYNNPVWEGKYNKCRVTVDDGVHYFVVRTVGQNGIESEDSNEMITPKPLNLDDLF